MPTRSSSLGNNVSTAVDREIGSQYDNVKTVAENIESVVTVADHIDNVDTVATNIVDVHAVGGSIVDVRTVAENIDNVVAVDQNIANVNTVAANIDTIVTEVVPNIDEIVNSSTNAAIATAKANEAATSAANALVSEQNAKASELAAGVSEDNAAASETVAIAKAAEAEASAVAAHNSELAAEALLDAFNDRYLGSFEVDPTTDNDGQPLLDGALYYNTISNVLKVYDISNSMWYTIPQVQLSTLLDVQLTSVTTGDVLTWNGSKWINTRDVILDSLQLRGGTGTQGTFSWNADEETVDLVQNGAVLQLGQEVQTHVRNTTASTISSGKVVMVTGTIGASGRITVGLYDGVSEVKYILGVCTEDIAAGDDGKVTHFGKVRGVNTSAWDEGDLLYPTTNGGFTNVAPTSGVRLALAIVITKHAINGTIMVRANGVNENAYEPKNANIQTHITDTNNPHNVTKTQVGLSNVDNTSDANKPVSTAAQAALDLKANLDSPALTGTPLAPTASTNTNTTQIATTAFVQAQKVDTVLTGTPTTPTAVVGTNTTQIASTAYVKAEISNETYSKTQLNAGQLDNRYYTETELNSGALDTRYYTETEIDMKLAAQNDASEISVTPSGNLVSTNVQYALVELQGDIDIRYTKTEADTLLAGKVDDNEIASVNLLRADKYLAAQNIANMTYVSGDLAKIQYNTATDVDYETLGYTSGNLTSINHYVGSVLKGTTTLSYTAGNLTSAVFVGV